MRNRVPTQYFVTKGSGDSELEIHAGSYHMALKKANIHPYNIIKYSSVLPAYASEISIEEGIEILEHGSELCTILSEVHGDKGDVIQAGIAKAILYDIQDNPIICLVVECNTILKQKDNCVGLEKHLKKVLLELADTFDYKGIGDINIYTNEHTVVKKHGSCIVALCITEYELIE